MNPAPIPATATLRLVCLQAQLAQLLGNQRAVRDAITTASILLAARATDLADDNPERERAHAN